MPFKSTKTYGHEVGLSCCFRQWRATHSHCSLLHGYAIAVHMEFEADQLDERNWVMDFGGLKSVKNWLVATFDHTLIVAQDDPKLDQLLELSGHGLAKVVLLPAVGCEMFAMTVFAAVDEFLAGGNVRIAKVEVREHGANSGIYTRPVTPNEWFHLHELQEKLGKLLP